MSGHNRIQYHVYSEEIYYNSIIIGKERKTGFSRCFQLSFCQQVAGSVHLNASPSDDEDEMPSKDNGAIVCIASVEFIEILNNIVEVLLKGNIKVKHSEENKESLNDIYKDISHYLKKIIYNSTPKDPCGLETAMNTSNKMIERLKM